MAVAEWTPITVSTISKWCVTFELILFSRLLGEAFKKKKRLPSKRRPIWAVIQPPPTHNYREKTLEHHSKQRHQSMSLAEETLDIDWNWLALIQMLTY